MGTCLDDCFDDDHNAALNTDIDAQNWQDHIGAIYNCCNNQWNDTKTNDLRQCTDSQAQNFMCCTTTPATEAPSAGVLSSEACP